MGTDLVKTNIMTVIKDVIIEDYKESIILKGDTRPVKDVIKRLGGSWNKTLAGWIFPKRCKENVQKWIDTGEVIEQYKGNTSQDGIIKILLEIQRDVKKMNCDICVLSQKIDLLRNE